MTQINSDVLIIGAGLSGIGAAVHLTRDCPDRTYKIVEARDAIGGTWDLFRYPGIRSDSDMHTLGYNFKPWTSEKAIADGPTIRTYVRETADEYGIKDKIQFNTKVVAADWSSETDTWTVTLNKDGARETTTCRFLFMCGGYYSYDAPYKPDFPGEANFKGQVIHPQLWPEDLDYEGKRVVVIGSGATAVTLVPAMADKAEHITMLQRSPTYVVSRPGVDKVANGLRAILPDSWAYKIVRTRNVMFQQMFYKQTQNKPEKARETILKRVRDELGPDYDVDKHFTPKYNPWEQRLCLVPDSDLFTAIKSGKASVATDTIETFTEDGIRLASGEEIKADIIVSATGLNLEVMNGVNVSRDGVAVDASAVLNYKGVMYSNVPNMAVTFGYTNASWTLKADLTSEYVCRLLNHMSATGTTHVVPALEHFPNDTEPFVTGFSSGYFARAMDKMPRQHTQAPWRLHMNYFEDMKNLRKSDLEDGVLTFGTTKTPALQAAE